MFSFSDGMAVDRSESILKRDRFIAESLEEIYNIVPL